MRITFYTLLWMISIAAGVFSFCQTVTLCWMFGNSTSTTEVVSDAKTLMLSWAITLVWVVAAVLIRSAAEEAQHHD